MHFNIDQIIMACLLLFHFHIIFSLENFLILKQYIVSTKNLNTHKECQWFYTIAIGQIYKHMKKQYNVWHAFQLQSHLTGNNVTFNLRITLVY